MQRGCAAAGSPRKSGTRLRMFWKCLSSTAVERRFAGRCLLLFPQTPRTSCAPVQKGVENPGILEPGIPGKKEEKKKHTRHASDGKHPSQSKPFGGASLILGQLGRPCTTLAQRPRLGQSLSRLKYYKQDRPTLQVSRALSFNQGERRWPPSSPYCLESLQPHLLPQPTLRQECLAEPASANQCVQNKVTEGTNKVYRLALKQHLVVWAGMS